MGKCQALASMHNQTIATKQAVNKGKGMTSDEEDQPATWCNVIQL